MQRLFFLLILLPLFGFAQDKGIRFEHGLSWSEIQAKAKAENKYIFMDCFTTWCGPCKYMSSNVFTQESVGNFFNEKYINVKVQMDSTAKDNEDIKKWYADASHIASKYSVTAYPTFLFFAPDGNVVHKMTGLNEATALIQIASEAMDPSKQYFALLNRFEKGETNPEFLKAAALAAKRVSDKKNAIKIANAYLKTQKNLLAKENIELLEQFTTTSKDRGFKIFMTQPAKVNAVLGKYAAENRVNDIIFAEEIVPFVSTKKTATPPDWKTISANITKKYPKQADEVISFSKASYYSSIQDWKNFQATIVPCISKYGSKLSGKELNEYASTILEYSNDTVYLQKALEWSKRSFKNNDDNCLIYMDTYAHLLYKLGKKEEAIECEKKALSAPANKKYKDVLQKRLDKMINDKETENK